MITKSTVEELINRLQTVFDAHIKSGISISDADWKEIDDLLYHCQLDLTNDNFGGDLHSQSEIDDMQKEIDRLDDEVTDLEIQIEKISVK